MLHIEKSSYLDKKLAQNSKKFKELFTKNFTLLV